MSTERSTGIEGCCEGDSPGPADDTALQRRNLALEGACRRMLGECRNELARGKIQGLIGGPHEELWTGLRDMLVRVLEGGS